MAWLLVPSLVLVLRGRARGPGGTRSPPTARPSCPSAGRPRRARSRRSELGVWAGRGCLHHCRACASRALAPREKGASTSGGPRSAQFKSFLREQKCTLLVIKKK